MPTPVSGHGPRLNPLMGKKKGVEKVNSALTVINRLKNMRGDGVIDVAQTDQGTQLRVNMVQLAARLPKSVNSLVAVRIDSTAAGAEKYNGKIFVGSDNKVNPATNLTVADLGTVPASGSVSALIINVGKIGSSGHALSVFPAYTLGKVVGISTDSRPVVAIGDLIGSEMRFHITGNSTNDFEYQAESITGAASLGSLGTTAGAWDIYVQNLAEWGSSDGEGHHVTAAANLLPTYGNGIVVGNHSDGKPIVQGYVLFNCED